ncbi:MAG: hypothetical protein ABIR46_00315 [Candidatus Saccharimonadales bacterium]
MNSTQATRLIENEAIFRRYNERVENGFEELKQLAADDGSGDVTVGIDRMQFEFFCECSDENCKKRIKMKMADYSAIHKDRKCFIILPNHQVTAVEKIIVKKPTYFIVEKYQKPPVDITTLNKTDIQNV